MEEEIREWEEHEGLDEDHDGLEDIPCLGREPERVTLVGDRATFMENMTDDERIEYISSLLGEGSKRDKRLAVHEKEITRTKRRIRLLYTAGAVLIGVVIFQQVLWAKVRSEAAKGAQTHEAVCLLREDLRDRIGDNLRFLAHPERYRGFEKLNKTIITNQVKLQHGTLEALGGLSC